MKIALVGNPNTGKSSVFNMLTGLRQQVGNFPGVTVDLRQGTLSLDHTQHTLLDLPGTYSIFPRSSEENVVREVLCNPTHPSHPDLVLFVADAAQIERNLLFFSQVYDLGIPVVLLLNMWDRALAKGLELDLQKITELFPGITIIQTNARVKLGKNRILERLASELSKPTQSFVGKEALSSEDATIQQQDANLRLEKIRAAQLVTNKKQEKISFSTKLDRLLTHPIWGYGIFALILMIIFQMIFTFASFPMDFIDAQFVHLSSWISEVLPEGQLSKLISQGLIPGIGGVLVFVPQIAILFFFIALLEETGYLSRVVFIMDKLMRPFGLNGKSVVPLLSSVACAIPGVMSARTISDPKERLITILVAPFMSCSARIPVYTLLISLVIPKTYLFGFINLQGLVLFGLYTLGIVFALLTAILLNLLLSKKQSGFHIMELPEYKAPRMANVGITVLEKAKLFITDAGKIIVAISILLWALASYGPNSREQQLQQLQNTAQYQNATAAAQEELYAATALSGSYMGQIGKAIEPAISPLGYDWKIGISLLTSFAAREVFVGSLATIYAVGDSASNLRLLDRMKQETKPNGEKVFTLATGLSLLVFYVFAMQCMATLAVVKRETKTWKWPLIQLAYMGFVAYLSAFAIFNLLS
ncbi:MAG: ferrous iron transport protein [Bacteroidota bacterium]|jgi:ferrous iron transport protein B